MAHPHAGPPRTPVKKQTSLVGGSQKHRAKIIFMSKRKKKGVGEKKERIIEETGGENSPAPMSR